MIYPGATMYPGEESAFPGYADIWPAHAGTAWPADTDTTWPEE